MPIRPYLTMQVLHEILRILMRFFRLKLSDSDFAKLFDDKSDRIEQLQKILLDEYGWNLNCVNKDGRDVGILSNHYVPIDECPENRRVGRPRHVISQIMNELKKKSKSELSAVSYEMFDFTKLCGPFYACIFTMHTEFVSAAIISETYRNEEEKSKRAI